MAEYFAFDEKQADFIQQLAPAFPDRWAYLVRLWITTCYNSEGIIAVERFLEEKRIYLRRGLLESPPRGSLSQYIDKKSNAVLYYKYRDVESEEAQEIIDRDPTGCQEQITDGVLKIGPVRIKGLHGDAMEWIENVSRNAERILTHIEDLKSLCVKEMEAIKSSGTRFVLDPPVENINFVVEALRPIVGEHFKGMLAEEVYEVFNSKSGRLKMASDVIEVSAAVLEAIREAFELLPAQLNKIIIEISPSKSVTWITEKAHSNRFYDSYRAYCERYPNDEKGLTKVHDEIIRALKNALKQEQQSLAESK
ncbi:MAG: hypothetical protein IPH49_15000 [Ignavibacteria bacterium]|nr:hypothetical protein [Ignavibacteria bacterium]